MTIPLFPILAIGLFSPILWWGLGLGSIPVLVHLLHKRKYRESQWAAMRFLMEAARKNSRRIRLEQLILLAVRVLILLFLVAALRGTYDQAFGTYFQNSAPVHKIIVVDTSFSMGHQPAQSSRFDRAREIARQLVNETERGDALNLLRISNSQPRAIIQQPSFQKSEVIGEIEQLQITDEPGDVFATLQEVAEILEKAPEISNKKIILISDFQRNSWSPESTGQRAQIRTLLNEFSQQGDLELIDLGKTGTQNSVVTGIAAAEPFVSVGRPVHLQVTTRTFGITAMPGQLLELYVDDRLAKTQSIDLTPGTETRVDFTHTFATSGEHRIEARLQDDALPIDNRRWLSLPVKEQLTVLLVNGTPAGQPENMATHHVQLALAPQTVDEPARGIMKPNVISWGELSRADLTRYDCVFLCNIELFTQRESEILKAYVESGGGLIITLGDQVKADNYNLQLYREGNGILPAKLGNRIGNATEKNDFFSFDPDQLEHPIVQGFQGNPGTGLEATMTFEYFSTEIPEDSRAAIALRFNTGEPAIIDAPFGRGRTILITTSVDKKWGTWAVWAPSFVPLMHESILHAVSGQWRERQLLVGEPLLKTFPTRVLIQQATIRLPDETEKTISVTDSGEYASVAYSDTGRSGVYRLNLGPPLSRSELFAVNIDPRESDLRKLNRQELETELLPKVEFQYHTEQDEADFGRLTKNTKSSGIAIAERGGLARWFLFAALAMLLVEQLMAWNFLSGFLLLYTVISLAFCQQVLAGNTFWGSMLVIAFAGGFVAIVLYNRHRLSIVSSP